MILLDSLKMEFHSYGSDMLICLNIDVYTMDKHIVVQTVKPQTPERTGELSMICNFMLIKTKINVTKIPTLPGYASGGIRKLNQLNTTIMVVGVKT